MERPDAPTLPPELARRFELLRQQFRDGLAQRLELLEKNTELPELEKLLHQLAGAAGGYGYESLGQLARKAEQACRSDDKNAISDLKQELVTMLRQIMAPEA